MARRARKQSARPIGNRRDFEGASALAERMSGEPERDSAAELRLKSLLRELEKYDGEAEEDEADAAQDDYDAESAEPRRRWSDDG
jgi:hypothetical protein